MKRFPIPKALSEESKLFKIGPVVLDKRQAAICIASFFAYYMLYKQIHKFLPITGTEAVFAFSPLVVIALFFAFAKSDGRHLDFWFSRKVQSAFEPSVYLYARDPETRGVAGAFARIIPAGLSERLSGRSAKSPGRATKDPAAASDAAGRPSGAAGPQTPATKGPQNRKKPPKGAKKTGFGRRTKRKPERFSKKRPKRPRTVAEIRDTTQKVLGIDGLFWEMLRLEDNSYVVVVEVEPFKMHLTGADDKERILSAAVGLYNRLDFPVVEMTRAREGDVSDFAEDFKKLVLDVVEPGEQNLARSARDYLIFLDKVVKNYNVHDRRSYFVLPYTPKTPPARGHRNEGPLKRLLGRLGLRPTKKATRQLQQEAKDAYSTLGARYDLIADFCAEAGAEAKLVVGEALVEFVKDQTAGEKQYVRPEIYSPPTLEKNSPVTLQPHGYGALSERQLAKRVGWAEEVRGDSPPAVGLGDLTFSDKVAPDAMRVSEDWVRVGGRYHATLFCINYGPDVGLGDLRTVLNVSGRVKVVKYVEPIEETKAIRRAGTVWAELEAAAKTADNGDLITENDRNRNRQHAHHTLEELQSGNQRLFDVSLLVHCEADTKDALYDLVDKVKKKLAGRRIEAKLSREEALAGFKSCLPLGKNHLKRRYANRNLMTYALSCFFLHATYTVNHRDGILLGVDHYSGGLVVLNTRKLNNPHMTILGQSGAGKTVTVKAVSTRQRMRGHRVVVIDPVGDSLYAPVARAMDGAYVALGVGSSSRINPCDMGENYMNINVFTGAADTMSEEEYEKVRRAALEGALSGKVLMLTRLINLMLGAEGANASRTGSGLTAAQENNIDRAWHELYKDFGITEDPETHTKTPPTMQDFYDKIRETRYAAKLEEVSEQLYVWEAGSLKGIFSGHTNVDLTNKYLVLQIANVKGRAKAALMYGVLEFLSGKLSDRNEPSDCYVDEFHSLLKYEMSSEFAEEMVRSGRARNNGMCPVSQEVDEFLSSPAGQVIFKQCASRLLLLQNRKTAEILNEFIDLSDDQKERLATFRKGQGYLMVGENLIPMLITISKAEERLFDTNPEHLRQAAQDAKPGHAGLRDPLGIPASVGSDPEALARHLLAAPDSAGVANGDPAGTVPTPKPASSRSLPLPKRTAGMPPIYAVVGRDAPHVAYNLAGLLSQSLADNNDSVGDGMSGAARMEPLVLFVDAEGSVTRDFLESNGLPLPDAYLAPDEPPADFARYARCADGSRFAALGRPAQPMLKADNALSAVEAGPYACVVVACGSGEKDYYAEDWLKAATRVVAAGPHTGHPSPIPGTASGALAAALWAEQIRGSNGTLLATLGPEDRKALREDLRGRPDAPHRALYPLTSKEEGLEAGVTPYTFASVRHEPTAASFHPLAAALVAPVAVGPDPVADTALAPHGHSEDTTTVATHEENEQKGTR